MRLSEEIRSFFKLAVTQLLPDSNLYLFGSRAIDTAKGGDIDLLILGQRRLTWEEIHTIKWKFYKQFGEQKIDLVSCTKEENHNIKSIALLTGILL